MSTITTINPATEKAIQTYDVMTEKEAMERLEPCHAAFGRCYAWNARLRR
ncbi:MAG: hypothetical protein ABR522_08725 [Marinobacter sp.]